jgi:hypothetical protein
MQNIYVLPVPPGLIGPAGSGTAGKHGQNGWAEVLDLSRGTRRPDENGSLLIEAEIS